MSDQNEENKIIDADRIMSELDATKTDLESLRNDLLEKTQEVGFALEATQSIKTNFSTLLADSENINEHQPILSSGYYQLGAIRNEINLIRQGSKAPLGEIRGVVQSVYTMCSTSGSIAGTINPQESEIPQMPSFLIPSTEYIVNKLTALDPSLADSYREVEQTYYGTEADNIKTSLGVMRQTFDHFFNVLAPDDKVKESKYWGRNKNEKGELIVTRRERIQYSIATHVMNEFRANTLMNSLDMIINLYKELNRLHTRGRVNIRSSKLALFTIKHFLEDFIDAMGA